MPHWENWSGRIECSPNIIERPQDITALQTTLATASNVRVAGSGHSFTELVPTDATLISLKDLTGLLRIDRSSTPQKATVSAGTTIRDLGPLLEAEGLALANQGDIDAQALAGAVATATHGTGRELGCIASRVSALKIVLADGSLVELSKENNADLLAGASVSLGALGVFAEIQIECEPSYNLRERIWVQPPNELLEDWEHLRDSHGHFEFFAFPYCNAAMAKTLSREAYVPDASTASAEESQAQTGADSSGGHFAQVLELNRHDPQAAREAFCGALQQMKPSEDFGPSHRIFPSERNDRFNEMEYALPMENGVQCLREVLAAIEAADVPVLFPIEFRTVAADDLWLSPFYQRESAVIAVHQDAAMDHRVVFEVAEPILRRHGGRPHWGKMHTLGPQELQGLYPRWNDFLELRREWDPEAKFLNPYLARLFGEELSGGVS